MAQEILIESINTDGGVQSRVEINKAYVTEVVEQIEARKRLPAIEVYKDGSGIWMADGFHRLAAHVEAGKRNIKANVHKGGKNDAIWASCAANQAHGLRRTNEDKRKAGEMALGLHADLSNRAIAEHVGVSDRFVSSLRKAETGNNGNNGESADREGLDGRKRRTPPPPELTTSAMEPELTTSATEPAPTAGQSVPPEKQDKVGVVIPDHLLPAWNRASEVLGRLVKTLQGVGRELIADLDDGSKVMLDGRGDSVLNGLVAVTFKVKSNIPYAVCPYCHGGQMQKGCRFCWGKGMVGKFMYENAPSDLKGG